MEHFHRVFAVLLLFITTALPTLAAEWEGVFEGTIGKAKVLVELYAGEEKSTYKGGYREGSRYSYLPKTRDINLILDSEGTSLHFTETLHLHRMFADEENKKITGKWEIDVKGAQALGTWTSPDGKKTLPITLTRSTLLGSADVSPNNNQLSASYDALWLETVNFTDAGTAKNFGAVEVRYLQDSAFGTKYPVFGKFPDGNQKAKINAMLLKQHMTSVASYRDCFNGVPVDWSEPETELVLNYNFGYATERLLSYTETGSVFCGGAHPNNYVNPQTFDLVALQAIGNNDVLDLAPENFGRILKLASKDERIAFERFVLGRWRAAAEKDVELGKDCIEGWIFEAAEGEKDFGLSFTEKSLAITRTDFPHVASVCLFADFNPTIIPWTDLKPWLKPGQNLLTLD
jgi:hypothetical protein